MQHRRKSIRRLENRTLLAALRQSQKHRIAMTSLLITLAIAQTSGAPIAANPLTNTAHHAVLAVHQQEPPGEAAFRRARIAKLADEAKKMADHGDPGGALEHLGEYLSDPYMLESWMWTLLNIYMQLGDWHSFLQVAEHRYADTKARRGLAGIPPIFKVSRAIGLHMTGQEQRAWQEMEWNPENYEMDLYGDALSNTAWRAMSLRVTPETHIIDLASYYCSHNRSFAGPASLQKTLFERYPTDQYVQFLYGRNVYHHRDSPLLEGEGEDLTRMLLQKASQGENEHIAREAKRLLEIQRFLIERGMGKG